MVLRRGHSIGEDAKPIIAAVNAAFSKQLHDHVTNTNAEITSRIGLLHRGYNLLSLLRFVWTYGPDGEWRSS